MTPELLAVADGTRVIGAARRGRHGRISFTYAEDWRTDPAAYPLSFSMPLAAAEHGHAPIENFLWGLLPDNDHVLTEWGRRFQVSSRNPFALMAHVGEDCAGAIQFVTPDRLPNLREPAPSVVEWLDEDAIADRLRTLRQDHAAWRRPNDTGQFSLAGAQPKTALFYQDGAWGIPSGRTPTTHILKPPTGEFDGHAENEHICLNTARLLGLIAARSEVRHFGNETAIVVERFDRRRGEAGLLRVHQEDMCQALNRSPMIKYENEGGPGVRAIVDLIRLVSGRPEDDEKRFIDALIFNWLIGGPDAHAKNYALLIGAGSRARLAPLYDIASVLPYPGVDPQKVRLAMKIGGEYRMRDIWPRQWEKLAADLRPDAGWMRSRAADLAEKLPDSLATACRQAEANGIRHPLLRRLTSVLSTRARQCALSLRTSNAADSASVDLLQQP